MSQEQDADLAADRRDRVRRDAALSPSDRLERVATLCRDLAALRSVAPPAPPRAA